jgi:3-deoxy-manno-octulosonate cytidylyltransferase (CMP-KDO synthetase)
MAFVVVIPARFSSTRLPGKPLADIAGKPMIQHVYERALQSNATKVIVATDDEQVKKIVESFNGNVLMTSKEHVSGTDRLEEVAYQLQLKDNEVVVNVQGDEPLIPPRVINQVALNLLNNTQASIATLSEPLASIDDLFDPNIVKVVTDQKNIALYFSRAAIPWARDDFAHNKNVLPAHIPYHRHVGIYAYRVSFLHQFVKWTPAPIEQAESLEQLRAMWYGVKIHVAQAQETIPAGVDTQADLERVRQILNPSA